MLKQEKLTLSSQEASLLQQMLEKHDFVNALSSLLLFAAEKRTGKVLLHFKEGVVMQVEETSLRR